MKIKKEENVIIMEKKEIELCITVESIDIAVTDVKYTAICTIEALTFFTKHHEVLFFSVEEGDSFSLVEFFDED